MANSNLEEKSKKVENEKVENKNINNNKKQEKHAIKKKLNLKVLSFIFLKIVLALIILFVVFIFLFFKTNLFQKYKEIWVLTAMTTMEHQYLAKWFLSDEEIQAIIDKWTVKNEEDSNSNEINIKDQKVEIKKEEIRYEQITGKNYVGYVMIVPDASKVKLIDARKKNTGTKLSELVRTHNAIAGLNAGGFMDEGGTGLGGQLSNATIMNKNLVFGSYATRYSFIGLSGDKKLILGNYTFNEAINAGIDSAIQFGPFLIVNGKNQINNSIAGGIHPRSAIGQRQDGTFIFVVVDGRQPGYSLGTNLLELQNIMNKYGAYNAANLDGGSSSTMCYDGKVINKPSTPAGERYLPNAFIVEK